MTTVTVQIPTNQVGWFEQMIRAMGWVFKTEEQPEEEATKPTNNRVYIENGEVKTDIVTETVDIEEMRGLLHKMVDLEYSLP